MSSYLRQFMGVFGLACIIEVILGSVGFILSGEDGMRQGLWVGAVVYIIILVLTLK